MDCNNNTDKAGTHAHWQALTANHKAALAAMVAEVGKYAGGVTHSVVFTPHLEVFHTGKLLVPGIEIKMKFHFNGPKPVFEWGGSRWPIDGRRCETTVSSLSTAFE